MLVFVAGGSGAVGRPLVSRLARAGHDVVATTRSAERAQLVRDAGAEPVVVDAFDADAFRRAIVSAKPDVVVHQLTALAKPAADYASWLIDTNRLRGEATAVLVDAAREAGASRVVAQSASFMTVPEGPDVLDEQAPRRSTTATGSAARTTAGRGASWPGRPPTRPGERGSASSSGPPPEASSAIPGLPGRGSSRQRQGRRCLLAASAPEAVVC